MDRLPRRIIREVASRCLDEQSFRELLRPTLLEPETLGRTFREQLVMLLHEEGRHGGPRKLFLELFQDEYGALLQGGTAKRERG
ncbi:MAG TPA: hypothetical protein VK447_09530 [Myxococcaceae bacterium]|nr:hypothetical protein [Myxococcaceae bacterium]